MSVFGSASSVTSTRGFHPPAGSSSAWLPITLLLLAVLPLSVLAGLVSATANKYLILGVAGIIGAFAIMATPATWIVWLLFVTGFAIIGPVIFFLGFTQLQWLPALMAASLLLPVAMHRLIHRDKDSGQGSIPGFLIVLGLYFLVVSFGTAIDQPELIELINASRWYLFYWPLLLVFMFGLVQPQTVKRIWQFLFLVLMVQLPMAVYQFFVAKRSARAMTPWDAVVGTFPGGEETGGDSAAMAIFVLVAMLFVFTLWRARRYPGVLALVAGVSGLGYLALAEVKAAVLLMPVVVAVYYRREIARFPLQAILLFVGACLAIVVFFIGYQKFYYENAANTGEVRTALENVENALSPQNVDRYRPQIGRVTHFVYWRDEHARTGDLQHALFGHGVGAVHTTRLGSGEIARRYPIRMDVSSSVILLWETGVLGHGLFLLTLLMAAHTSGRLARQERIPEWHRIALRIGAIGLLLLAITLPYKDFALRSTGIQLLLMLLLGQVAYWWRWHPHLQSGEQSMKPHA